MRWIAVITMCSVFIATAAAAAESALTPAPRVTAPPDSFFELVRDRDREPARNFYKKYLTAQGMPVVAAQEVDDLALQRTHEIVTRMLAGRPDVVQAMAANGMYLIICI